MNGTLPPGRATSRRARRLPYLLGLAVGMGAYVWAVADDSPGRYQADQEPVQPNEGLFWGHVVFTPSVQLSTTYDANVFKVDPSYNPPGPIPKDNPQGDFLMVGEAHLAFKVPFSHSYAALKWTPTYRSYAHTATERKTAHVIQFDSLMRFSSGSKLAVKADYLSGFFESRRYDSDYEPTLSSTPFRRDTANVDYERYLTTLTGIGGSYTYYDFKAEPTVVPALRSSVGGTDDQLGRYFDYFDYVTNALEVRGFWERSRYRFFTNAGYSVIEQDRRNVNESQFNANGCDKPQPPNPEACRLILKQVDTETIRLADIGVGARGELFRATNVDVEVGYADWRFLNQELDPFKGFQGIANIERRLSPDSTLNMTVERTPVQTSSETRGFYMRRTIAFGFARALGPALGGGVRFVYSIYRFPGSNQAVPTDASDSLAESLNGFRVSDFEPVIELIYRARRDDRLGPLQLKLSYNPLYSSSDLDGLDISGNRLTFSMQYGWF